MVELTLKRSRPAKNFAGFVMAGLSEVSLRGTPKSPALLRLGEAELGATTAFGGMVGKAAAAAIAALLIGGAATLYHYDFERPQSLDGNARVLDAHGAQPLAGKPEDADPIAPVFVATPIPRDWR